ncbi:PcfJ domain-containing protein [Aestuariibaculum marinum]|uniref:PcfJ domain-containing protein n=1 Tax=Aestuariibaculum marinum TaxID=2683592 RepID=A0A8J6Q0H2_9FLAO|nr:PcfJ domain-containing protein [Aestuariibaculum marinum]MBD0822618.1 PcfJ domain-containing protein [Aestuariibaculum marinum]
MKPRTKLQKEVFGLSKRLPELTLKQKEWAYQVCTNHLGYATKTRVICMDCGETFSPELVVRKRAVCPHCKTKLKVEDTKMRTHTQVEYMALAEVVGEYQVIRNFELYAHHKKGKKVRYHLHEILQYWITPEGKVQKVGLLHMTSGFADCWTGDWAIRTDGGYYSWNANKYLIYPYKYFAESRFKPEYKKIGINKNLYGLTVPQAIKLIPSNPRAETLLKAKQYSLLYKFNDRSGELNRRWNSIKICLRNNYKVKDATTWLDYLDLLQYFNKDLRNAKYVCPKDLNRVHDRLVEKKRNIQRKRELEEQKKKVVEAQKEYQKMKSAFFGLAFTDGEITVKVLEHVKEFLTEGDLLKHCVFANAYYNKKDSLVLSARINDEPVETIEVSLATMKIVQARGYKNQATEYNDRIVKLVNRNLKIIKSIAKKQPDLMQQAS